MKVLEVDREVKGIPVFCSEIVVKNWHFFRQASDLSEVIDLKSLTKKLGLV